MDGEGKATDGERSASAFELGTVLAQLSVPEPETHEPAVETIRQTVDEEPGQCLPTVPKLRTLLGTSTPRIHEDVAYCLERLAAESPDDVAPSVPAIVSFLAEEPALATTESLLECLEAVATERPKAVAEELESVSLPPLEETVEGKLGSVDGDQDHHSGGANNAGRVESVSGQTVQKRVVDLHHVD